MVVSGLKKIITDLLHGILYESGGIACHRTKMAEDSDQNNWQVDMEVNLFHAMRGHKPVGRYFVVVYVRLKVTDIDTQRKRLKIDSSMS